MVYTLQISLALLFGSTLDELRDTVEFVRAAPSRPPGLEGYIEVDRENMLPDDERIIYDDPDWVEEEDIIGVHYEDDEGNLLPLPHGPEQGGDEEGRIF
ncbi:hypothetical protein I310_03736 [Cryptococcus deuterogattii CA1014]|nr:hypothetical protein I310_03736 [Cryptococcus deuterogattii CA1014]